MNLPIPEYGKTDRDTINNLMDTVAKLRKELEYALYHLDEQNIPMMKSVLGDIDEAFTAIEQNENSITLLAHDLDGAEAQITIQGNQITNLVTTTDGHTAQLTIQAGQISSKVGYGEVISSINQSPESIDISASRINLYGITAVNDVLQIGYTNTDGKIRFRSSGGSGSYVELYSSGEFEAYDLNVECSTMNILGNQYIQSDLSVSGRTYLDNYLNINNLGGTAISSYGHVDFWGGHVRVDGTDVALQGHTHSEYVKTMSSQNLRMQIYDGALEVWNGSTYEGRVLLT